MMGACLSGQIAIEWYISRDGQQHGPFTEGDLARFVAQGQVLDADYVWHSGLDQWKLYREYRAGPASAPAFDDHTRASSPANAPRKCSFCLFVRKVLRVPYDTLATAFELLVRPTRFAQQRIDVGPRDLYRASYFWFNFFTVAFLVGSSLTHFAFYEGASELRELGMIAVQIAAAVPIIYLLNIAFRQPVRFSGVA